MAKASLQIDQLTLPVGDPDTSRSDGLDTGLRVTLTSVDPGTTNDFTFLWVPEGDTNAVGSLVNHGDYATFYPSPGVYGTYRIQLDVNRGTFRHSSVIRTFSIRTPNLGLRKPALGERASENANLVNSANKFIVRSENNEADPSGPFASGNYGGWYGALIEVIDAVESLAGGSGITALTGEVTASGTGSVVATIAADAVTTAKIAALNVTTAKIADQNVTTAKIADSNVTTAKIADSNVTTAKLAASAVTNAKLANVATGTFKARTTAGTGAVEDLTAAQATALLSIFGGDSGSGGTKGLVPAPAAGDASNGYFLKADGSWAAPSVTLGAGSVSYVNTDRAFSWLAVTTALSNITSAQSIFPAAQDSVVVGGGTYRFRAYLSLTQSGGTSAIWSFLIGGGISFTALNYLARTYLHTSSAGVAQALTPNVVRGGLSSAVPLMAAASASTQKLVLIEGMFKTSGGGTFTPQLSISSTGVFPQVEIGSWFEVFIVGAGSFTNWNFS